MFFFCFVFEERISQSIVLFYFIGAGGNGGKGGTPVGTHCLLLWPKGGSDEKAAVGRQMWPERTAASSRWRRVEEAHRQPASQSES